MFCYHDIVIKIRKPVSRDLPSIEAILSQWNDGDETEKYVNRVRNEIEGHIEFDMRFWALELDGEIVGMGGMSDCQPKLEKFIQTEKPKELKAIYLDNSYRGKGLGRSLVGMLEEVAIEEGYQELLLVSAVKYRKMAYDFYEKLGYQQLGEVEGGEVGAKMAVFSKMLK